MKTIQEEKITTIVRCIDAYLALNVGGRQQALSELFDSATIAEGIAQAAKILGLTAEEAEMI